jgi:hypothetical protein
MSKVWRAVGFYFDIKEIPRFLRRTKFLYHLVHILRNHFRGRGGCKRKYYIVLHGGGGGGGMGQKSIT